MRTTRSGIGRAAQFMLAVALFALFAGVSFNGHAQAQVPGISADSGGPYYGSPGQPVFFSGQVFTSFGFGVTQFQWSFGDGSSGFGQNTTHIYPRPGTYFVTLTAIDPSGATASDSTTATISGAGPGPGPTPGPIQANPGGPYSGIVGQPVLFSGTVITPFGFGVTQFQWSFGDGTTGFGQSTSHAYGSPGTFFVTLTVIDPSGNTASASTTATIGGGAPIGANAGGPYAGTPGTPVTMFGSVAGGAPFPAQYQYVWSFGDGTSGNGATTSHIYAAPGVYNVTLTVSASTGQSAIATTTATIRQTLTVSAGGPYSGTTGRPVSVSGIINGATNPQSRWDFGDGTSAVGQSATHTYQAPGTFTARFSVTDIATGQTGSDSTSVTIVPGGPTVTYAAGWNIVSAPAGTTFSQAASPLFTFQPGDTAYRTIPNTSPVSSGWGYWAYFPQAVTQTLSGTSQGNASIVAPPGQFIMVGNPSANYPVTIRGADTALTWDPVGNMYRSTSSLAPGAGAWVIAYNGGTITLSP